MVRNSDFSIKRVHLADHPGNMYPWQQGVLQLVANNLDLKISHGIPNFSPANFQNELQDGAAVTVKAGMRSVLSRIAKLMVKHS